MAKGGRTSRYILGHPPTNSDDGLYTYNELSKIYDWITQPIMPSFRIEITNVEPGKPDDGDVYFADGTNWNPGSGRGLYAYVSGAWTKL